MLMESSIFSNAFCLDFEMRCPFLRLRHSLLLAEGYEPDVVYTSRLHRAIKSVWLLLGEIQAPYLPVYKTWR